MFSFFLHFSDWDSNTIHIITTICISGDWERASGLAIIDCDNSTGKVYISICNALPEAIYTVIEVGIVNPGQSQEGIYALPLGGVGNVIRTDENGNGELYVNLAWCPVRQCIVNVSIDCQLYFNVNHNSDYIVYGGDTSRLFWKPNAYPTGIAGAVHLWFPIFGEFLQEPLNRYNKRQCKRKGRGRRRLLDVDDDHFNFEMKSNIVYHRINLSEIVFIIAMIIVLLP